MVKKNKFRITPKHRRFIQFYVKLGNQSEAGRLAGFNEDYARELFQNPAISHAIRTAEEKAGLSDELLLRTHLELLTEGDHNIKVQALRLGYQVKKKIGSDEPPPGLPPAVIIIRDTNGTTGKDRVPADAAANVSIRRAV